jgi:predicted methyltransferase
MTQAWKSAVLALGFAMLMAGVSPAHADRGADRAAQRAIAGALSTPGRPADSIKLDESRKPAQVLVFMGLKPGMAAADLISGTGYWAELMARVVGPQGRVTAFEPEQFYADAAGQAAWRELVARQPNVALSRYPFEAFNPPSASFDVAIINLSYHDLYWESVKYNVPRTDPAAYLRALYASMKPGGAVIVIDHIGPSGDTRAIVEALHRIDPAVVKADFAAAGFRLSDESPILANAADSHDTNVFDAAIRGRTDRFMFRFEKGR